VAKCSESYRVSSGWRLLESGETLWFVYLSRSSFSMSTTTMVDGTVIGLPLNARGRPFLDLSCAVVAKKSSAALTTATDPVLEPLTADVSAANLSSDGIFTFDFVWMLYLKNVFRMKYTRAAIAAITQCCWDTRVWCIWYKGVWKLIYIIIINN